MVTLPEDPQVASSAEVGAEIPDPLARFRSWHGFLLAALAVNGLFVWGMLDNARDPLQRIWFQTLVWLPFNAIATAVYYAVMQRLPERFYWLLCTLLIVANWLIMFIA